MNQFLILAALLFSSLSSAEPVSLPISVTFQVPVAREDGAALQKSDIAVFRVYDVSEDPPLKIGADLVYDKISENVSFDVISQAIASQGVGEICVKTVDNLGAESSKCSAPASFEYNVSGPEVPGAVSAIAITTTITTTTTTTTTSLQQAE